MQRSTSSSLIIFCIGLIATAIVWFAFFELIESTQIKSFQEESHSLIQKVESRLQVYNGILLGSVGLFAASDEVTPEEWSTFIKSTKLIESYPGIQGVGFNKYLQNDFEKPELVKKMNEYGYTDFEIKPVGSREMYFPVIYIFPENEANKRAIGYDIYSESVRSKAVDNAITLNEMSITGKIVLVQEGEGEAQNGFLMLIPVYESNLEQKMSGLISAVFRVNDLIFEILEEDTFQKNNVRIYETVESQENQLFDSNKFNEISNLNENFSYIETISFGNMDWVFVIDSPKPELTDSEKNLLIAIPIVGVSISIMGFVLFLNFNKTVVAKQIQKRRDEFDSMISHELKTPLVPIMGYCDMLLYPEYLGKLNDGQLHAVKKIVTNVDHMKMLIQNILDSQKMDLNQLKLEYSTVNLKDFISEIVFSHTPITSEKGISLSMNNIPNIQVTLDASRIKEVITNIILNAIDFLPEKNGKISITATELEDNLRISISNNGSQIPHEHLNLIFDKFHQVETGVTRRHGGSGLGLAVCKGIIQLHGGKIWVESDKNITSFIFEINLKANK